ncbi:Cupin domain protein [Caballeronia fortuita]|uniref:Cupin domain protein n=1 Tax=Caballeronia fortuita TaxID=1777138 RepID=A0A158CXH0_9BURK|nr:cupin domain-containing protein [Caballeronia fortuita]SAK86297.1 Cupin domain protein [Caballeronia fortuita]
MRLVRRTAIALTLVLITARALAAPAAAAAAGDPEKPVSTVLLKTERSWDGKLYKRYPAGRPQLTVLKIVIPAHTTLPWHMHPMPNVGYVLSGNLHVESRDGHHQTTLHAGDVLPEMVGSAHRGYTDNSPVKLIVFYAGGKGLPTATTVH